jgi:hypothetical protein
MSQVESAGNRPAAKVITMPKRPANTSPMPLQERMEHLLLDAQKLSIEMGRTESRQDRASASNYYAGQPDDVA